MSVRDVGLRIRTVLIDTSSCIPFIRGIGIVNLSLLFWVLFSISEVIVCRLACIEIPICTNTCPYVSSVLYWLYKLSTYRHIFYTNSLVTGMYSIHTTCKGIYWVPVVHVFNINKCQYRLNTYHNMYHTLSVFREIRNKWSHWLGSQSAPIATISANVPYQHIRRVLARARVQVLQNSGSRMVVLRFTTLSALDRHWQISTHVSALTGSVPSKMAQGLQGFSTHQESNQSRPTLCKRS